MAEFEGNWFKYDSDRWLEEHDSEIYQIDKYTPDEFTPHGIVTKDVIQYVLDEVHDFHMRYAAEMCRIGRNRCPIDHSLLCEIYDAASYITEEDSDELWDDVSEVFA